MKSRKILIIDDDDLFRKSLRLMLEESGFAIVEANDGAAGLQAASSEAFDLVITDIIMPNKEGIETILEIRRRHPKLPIIAISGGGRLNPREYLPTARAFGAAAVLEKPFSLDALLGKIEEALAKKANG
jgi:two-component system, chemotaxis family, chemotaxis protein CheY